MLMETLDPHKYIMRLKVNLFQADSAAGWNVKMVAVMHFYFQSITCSSGTPVTFVLTVPSVRFEDNYTQRWCPIIVLSGFYCTRIQHCVHLASWLIPNFLETYVYSIREMHGLKTILNTNVLCLRHDFKDCGVKIESKNVHLYWTLLHQSKSSYGWASLVGS